MDSQPAPPERVDELAVQIIELCPLFRIPKLCGSGAPPWATAAKVSPICDSRIFGRASTMVSVTGSVNNPAAPPSTVIWVEYVPDARVEEFVVTVTSAGELGVTLSADTLPELSA